MQKSILVKTLLSDGLKRMFLSLVRITHWKTIDGLAISLRWFKFHELSRPRNREVLFFLHVSRRNNVHALKLSCIRPLISFFNNFACIEIEVVLKRIHGLLSGFEIND